MNSYYHNFISKYRTESVPVYQKPKAKAEIPPNFKKSESVFKDWREPTETDMERILMHDIQHWKVLRFIKDSVQFEETIQVLKKY